MVNVRSQPSSSPKRNTYSKRKRTGSPDSSVGTTKRRLASVTPESSRLFSREGSPSKSVHFGRNLIQGPTVSDPVRRSQSPTRPAIQRQDATPRSSGLDGPGAQLQLELEQARKAYEAVRPKPKKGKTKAAMVPNTVREPKGGITKRIAGVAVPLGLDKRGLNAFGEPSKRKRPNPDDCLIHLEPQRTSKAGKKQQTQSVAVEDWHGEGVCELIISDDEICAQLNDLLSLALDFADSFPALQHRNHDLLDRILKPSCAELVRYIGCLALGGRDFVDGWRDLLNDDHSRRALVLGIIGRALKEKVFGSLYFGASKELEQKLAKKEKAGAGQDGFSRTRERSDVIILYEPGPTDESTLLRATARLTLQLEKLLLPLWNGVNPTDPRALWRQSVQRAAIARIVTLAAELSRKLRKERSVVYQWTPCFKDEEFEPARMECLNLKQMITTSPYDKEVDAKTGTERAMLQDGNEDRKEAIVHVVCWPGLVAYRRGGGDLAQRELEAEEHKLRERDVHLPPDVKAHRARLATAQKPLTGKEGFRSRTLFKSVVLLQWSKQRLLTKEAGTSLHIDAVQGRNGATMAKYDQDSAGFLELGDIYHKKVHEGDSLAQIDADAREDAGKARSSSWGGTVGRMLGLGTGSRGSGPRPATAPSTGTRKKSIGNGRPVTRG